MKKISFLTQFIVGVMFVGCGPQLPAPVVHFGTDVHDSGQTVVVRSGDTLYDISRRHQIPLRSLIDLNQIDSSFKVNMGRVLKLPNPDIYTVSRGDTVRDISKIFGVDQSEIVRLNRLKAPYDLKIGQVLRLPPLQYETRVARTSVRHKPSQEIVQDLRVKSVDRKPQQTKTTKTVTGKIVTQDLPPLPDTKPNAPKAKQQVASYKPSKTRIKKRQTPKTYGTGGAPKFGWPLQGRVMSKYGAKSGGRFNDGINIAAPKGTPIRAAESGEVVYIGNELAGFGNLMLVRHNKGWMTAYAHIDRSLVSKGSIVKKGQSLATVGKSGSISSPQLHFEIRKGSKPLDPDKYLP